ncbi:hypothetical protein TNCV_1081351 [Trichonephila clavipes]|nr:hypothetical protein TNCV_1081351 [Trichonephila clavipes]
MATGSYLTPNYSRSQSEIQGDLHKVTVRFSSARFPEGTKWRHHLSPPPQFLHGSEGEGNILQSLRSHRGAALLSIINNAKQIFLRSPLFNFRNHARSSVTARDMLARDVKRKHEPLPEFGSMEGSINHGVRRGRDSKSC